MLRLENSRSDHGLAAGEDGIYVFGGVGASGSYISMNYLPECF
jgi:hypothetical protein